MELALAVTTIGGVLIGIVIGGAIGHAAGYAHAAQRYRRMLYGRAAHQATKRANYSLN